MAQTRPTLRYSIRIRPGRIPFSQQIPPSLALLPLSPKAIPCKVRPWRPRGMQTPAQRQPVAAVESSRKPECSLRHRWPELAQHLSPPTRCSHVLQADPQHHKRRDLRRRSEKKLRRRRPIPASASRLTYGNPRVGCSLPKTAGKFPSRAAANGIREYPSSEGDTLAKGRHHDHERSQLTEPCSNAQTKTASSLLHHRGQQRLSRAQVSRPNNRRRPHHAQHAGVQSEVQQGHDRD